MREESIKVPLDDARSVSALLLAPNKCAACYVFAHGAGAGMAHPFMAAAARGFADRGIATLRYQFLYMEECLNRPDPPKVAHAVVRAAVQTAQTALPGVSLFAGGKSFGGRMTSQAQALAPLDGVRGLIFFGFPLHPAGKPATERAAHLADVNVPMLFLQGTRDALATAELIEAECRRLAPIATLHLFEGADHSFHVPARTGKKDPQILDELLDASASWMRRHGA
jgi:predicted alpha/beta-hydrolase family hydrolase